MIKYWSLGWVAAATFVLTFSQAAVAQRRLTDRTTWITSTDYPPEALAAGLESEVGVVYTITAQGRVADCRVNYVEVETFGELTCRLLEGRELYEPAYDRRGRAISSRGSYDLIWSIEGGAPAVRFPSDFGDAVPLGYTGTWLIGSDLPIDQLGTGSLIIEFDITTQGRMANCRLARESWNESLDAVVCRAVQRRARFRSPRGRDGRPRATSGFITVVFTVTR